MIIQIIGCGSSGKDWFNTPSDLSIGVNDCSKWGKNTDWLVVVNRHFTPEREKIILNSQPKKVLTHLQHWKKHFPQAEIIRMQQFGKYLKKGHGYSSKTSPFIAVSLAFNEGATNIILHGCDLVNHGEITGKVLAHELRQWERFCRLLAESGTQVWVSSKESALSKFLPLWESCCDTRPIKFHYDFSHLDDLGCNEEILSHIKTLNITTDGGKEWIMQVMEKQPNVFPLGEIEVIKNDGVELILKGEKDLTCIIDLTDTPEGYRIMKVGDKFHAYATAE